MSENLKNKDNLLLNDSRQQQLIKNIQALMEEQGLSETKLAKGCNLPQPTIHRLLSGETTDPRLSTLLQIVDFLGVSFDALLTSKSITQQKLIKTIPIISWGDSIRAKEVVPQLTLNNWQQWATIDIGLSELSYGLLSKSNMKPRFPMHSLLIVDPEEPAQDGDLVLVRFDGTDEATLREIIIDGPNKQLKSILNIEAENIIYNQDKHKIFGTVIQVRFDTKILAPKNIKEI